MSNITFQPLSAGLATTGNNGAAVNFEVTNNSSQTLTLDWLNTNGTAVSYATIAAGQTVEQPTYTNGAWEITNGTTGFEFISSVAGNVVVGANLQPTFQSYAEQIVNINGHTWSTAQGYGVINCATSLGITNPSDALLPIGGENNNLALDAIDAPAAWAAGYTGKGVTVAVCDVGIASNPEINGNIVGSYNVLTGTNDAQPTPGAYQDHPLGVASLIAGNPVAGQVGPSTTGVAPDASILNIKVGDDTGSSYQNIATGIEYAVNNGAKVICVPLEGTENAADPSVVAAVNYAYTHNVVTVIIGGNYSNYGPTSLALIAQMGNESIDVGNFNAETGQAFTSSNMPGTTTPFNWVEASSTGYVPNSSGGFTFWEDGGTSFAGPYVAGLAALLFQQNPNATASQIMAEICDGASVDGAPSYDQSQASLGTATSPIVHTATVQNQSFTSAGGYETFTGIGGVDTVTYSGSSANYTVTQTATGETVTSTVGSGTHDTLTGIDRIVFTDSAIAYDTTGNAGEVYSLYQAAFDRTPDPTGLGYWIAQMDKGASLTSVANSFIASGEFQGLFGSNAAANPDAFVTALYNNVLHRAPDSSGYAYWTGELTNHLNTDAQVLVSFAESAENQAALVGVMSHGITYTPYHA